MKIITYFFKTKNIRSFFITMLLILYFQNSFSQVVECNAENFTALTSTISSNLSVSSSTTGAICVGCSITDPNNLTDADLTNYATANTLLGVGITHHFKVSDSANDYGPGAFAGFRISPSGGILSADLLGSITVKTYLNGVEQESVTGNSLINLTVLSDASNYYVGFNTTQPFDEIELLLNSIANVSTATKVYYGIIRKYCPGPQLPCNVVTTAALPLFPLSIESAHTGISGVTVGSINDLENIINSNNNDFATINLVASVIGSGSIAVKDQLTDYPAGTYAGFEIENVNLLSLSVIGNIHIRTYLNGVLKEDMSGNNPLVNIILLNSSGRQKIGFVSTTAFDEVQISIDQVSAGTLGITKVYGVLFEKFCPATVECDKTYALTNPVFPVVIDGTQTGLTGVACVGCSVNNTANVLTANTNDYADITLTAGVIQSASIAVKDQLYTYPKGTFAGFTIKDLNSLVQLNLFQSLTISTYNNGVFQESKSAGNLIDLSLLVPVLGSGPGFYNVGFKTTLSFDEIKISVNSLLSVINKINIYGAFVDTNDSDGGDLICTSTDFAITKTVDNLTPTKGCSNVTFTITASNMGTSNGTGVVVTDMLPDGYAYVSSNTVSGIYNNLTGKWNIGNLAKNASAILTITATVNGTGNYLNTATIIGNETDINLLNNSATAITAPVNLLAVTIGNTINATCQGGSSGSATAIATGGLPAYTYSWNTNPVQNTATATNLSAGTYIVTVTDANNCIATQSVTILDGDGIPPSWITLAGSLDRTVECSNQQDLNTAQGLFPVALDNIDTDVTNIIKTSGLFIASANCPNTGTYTNTWTVTDDCGNVSNTFTQVITLQDTTQPTWINVLPTDITVSCDAVPVAATLEAADNCDQNLPVVVSETKSNIQPGCANNYTLTRIWTTSDCSGNTASYTQIITVRDTTPPTGTAPASVSNLPNIAAIPVANPQDIINATDNCSSIVNIIINDTNNGGSGCTGNAYILTRTYTLSDCTGNTTDLVQTFTVSGDGIPPTWTNLSGSLDRTVECSNQQDLNTAQGLFPVALDNIDTDVTNIIKTSGIFIASTNCPNTGTYTNTWTVTDDCGNVSNTFTQVITIQDSTQPTWINVLPTDITVSCDAVPVAATLEAADNCDQNLPVVVSETKSNIQPGCANNYTLTRIWTTSDCAGNTASYTQIITVRDTTPPTGTAPASVSNLPNIAAIPAASPQDITNAADNCSSIVNIIINDTNNGGSGCTGNAYILTRTYTLSDCAGNTTDLVQTFTVSVNCGTSSTILATNDTAGPITGVDQTTANVVNVLTNDTLDNIVVTPSDVILTTVTANPFLQLNPDGSVNVLPNAPAGNQTLTYQICEADNTTNCSTATVTITIVAPAMTVTATAVCVKDVPYVDYVVTPINFSPTNGVTIIWANSNNTTISTMTNIPLSGRVLWPGAVVDQAGNGTDWPGWILQNNQWIQGADGFETLRPIAKLTFSVNPSETITVNYPPSDPFCTSRPTFAIAANDDAIGPINGVVGGTSTISVLNNDTLNTIAVNPNDITLTTAIADPKGALTLNPNGTVTIAPNTPAGTYTLTYQICENADNGNCDTALVTVTVGTGQIIANPDTFANISCTNFGQIGNVLTNDVLNGVPATLALINFTVVPSNSGNTNSTISIDASGNINVSNLTPAGTYTYNYQICEKLNPTNCSSGVISITVSTNAASTIISQACNADSSTINLSALLPANTPTTGTWIGITTNDALQGNILNPFGLAVGNYIFEYRITANNCPGSILLNLEVNDECKVLACQKIIIHNAFSPNGDNKNDTFQIDYIDDTACYPENTVEIYNRWGILVFETTNYNNDTNNFDGNSRGRTTIKKADGLPTGTYFYIINYKSLDLNNALKSNKEEGYLYIAK